MKLRLFAASLTLLAAPAFADLSKVPSGSYEADPQHAYILFSYSHLGLSNPTVGFNMFETTLDLDAENPENSRIAVDIDASSIDSRVPKFNEHLKSDDFFDAEQFPRIEFVSTEITRTDDMNFTVDGELTIKGITRPVTLLATINAAKTHPLKDVPAVGISALTSVKRSDFDLGAYVPAVSDDVEIRIDVEYVKP